MAKQRFLHRLSSTADIGPGNLHARGRRTEVATCLICLLLTLASPLRPVVEAASRLQEIPAADRPVAENNRFQLYLDSATLAFKLLDKRNNYVWHSGIEELQAGDRLNKSWQAFARSGISIEYLDEKAVNKRVSIANAKHTLEVTPIEQGVAAQVTFEDYGISVGLRLQLEEEGVRVEVPFASLREDNPKFRLGLVYVYPFLGATRGSSQSGYMLLPDGAGSLVRFSDSTKAKNMFYGRYYGRDLGMLAVLPWNPQVNPPYPLSLPVFGMVHGEGQNAYLSVVAEGAAYGEVQMHPAGILTNFNFIYNAFVYNESYFQATNRSGAGVTTVQKQPNAFDAVIHYRFLAGAEADYVGLAHSYQRYLVDKGLLHKNNDTATNAGIRLEFLGGDNEKVLFWNRFVPMTTLQQMNDILAGLQVLNPEVIYYGWQPLGASSVPPTSLRLESGLGSLSDLRALAQKVAADGGHFSLYLDPQAALYGVSGYSPRNDLAMAITNVSLLGYNRDLTHYFSMDVMERRYAALAKAVTSQPDIGLALDGVGWMLYSDFRESRRLNREQTIEGYQTLLAGSPLRLGFYRPNAYAFGLTQAYYDMPLGDNGYIYTSEAVPFLPIVLAGYVPYYGPALNFSPNVQADLLRHVDFGVYPSYFLTYQPTAEMLNTRSSWIYTSSYAQWGEQIRRTYRWLDGLLGPVRGQEIIARQKLAEDVFAITYANGRQIIVNYTERPVTHQGMTIAAGDAALLENGP